MSEVGLIAVPGNHGDLNQGHSPSGHLQRALEA